MRFALLPRSPTSAVSFYRTIGPLGSIQRQYKDFEFCTITEMNWSIAKQFHALIAGRPNTQTDLSILKIAKTNKLPILLEWDDDPYEVPLGNPAYHHHRTCGKLIDESFTLADLVICSTELIANIVRHKGGKAIVIPNAFDNTLFDMPTDYTPRRKNIVWRGGSSHVMDVFEHWEQIAHLAKTHPDWYFTFIGDTFGWFEGIPNIQFHPFVDLVDMFYLVQKLDPAICIVPLRENVFNKAKSNIAWIEATFARAVTLAPAWSEEWNKPGITRYKDRKDFGWKLNYMMTNVESWKGMWESSRDYINQNLLLTKLNEQRYEAIVQVVRDYYETCNKKYYL